MYDILFVALLGLIVGSFLNVVVLRLHTGRSTSGRSGCMSCGTQLAWTDLIPVVSFLILRGRCRECKSAISHQYWLVELATAVLFVLVWQQGFGIVATALAFTLISLLVAITAYDIRHTIIPNKLVYPFVGLAFVANTPMLGTFTLAELPLYVLLVIASGVVTALPLFLLWLVSRGAWMGLGDAKLALGFGFILGAYGGLMAVMLGFIAGAVIGLTLLGFGKVIKQVPLSPTGATLTIKSEIPFAPFLILGFLLVFLFDVDVLLLVDALL